MFIAFPQPATKGLTLMTLKAHRPFWSSVVSVGEKEALKPLRMRLVVFLKGKMYVKNLFSFSFFWPYISFLPFYMDLV